MDRLLINIPIFSKLISLVLWDVALVQRPDIRRSCLRPVHNKGPFEFSVPLQLSPAQYTNASVVLLCFGIDNPHSLKRVEEVWAPGIKAVLAVVREGKKKQQQQTKDEIKEGEGEMSMHLPLPPIMLVGCKKDVRTSLKELARMKSKGITKPVSVKRGRETANRIGAAIYLECSAKTGEGVDEVFQHAARLSLLATVSTPLR